jgi:hypothetical protein
MGTERPATRTARGASGPLHKRDVIAGRALRCGRRGLRRGGPRRGYDPAVAMPAHGPTQCLSIGFITVLLHLTCILRVNALKKQERARPINWSLTGRRSGISVMRRDRFPSVI